VAEEQLIVFSLGKEENRLLILLDVDKLFDEEERQELKKVG